MSVLDLARRELVAMTGYRSARLEAGHAQIMLNANECPWPLLDDGLALNRYPDPQPQDLLEKVAALHGVKAHQVLIGRGSDEAIDLLTRAFCRAGEDAILICPPTFGMYAVCAAVQGARVIEVPLDAARNFTLDTYRVIGRALTEEAKIVYLCSPNNPTGAVVSRADLLAVIEALAGHAVVVIDEAYLEFAGVRSLSSELARFEHLAILKTFSKAWGMAGARLGVLLANPEVIALLRKLMAPYPLPNSSICALRDALTAPAQQLMQQRVALVVNERVRLAAALAASAEVIEVLPSDANFLAFRAVDAAGLLQHLAQSGILLRDARKYLGLRDALRISVGTPDENDAVIAAIASHRAAVSPQSLGAPE